MFAMLVVLLGIASLVIGVAVVFAPKTTRIEAGNPANQAAEAAAKARLAELQAVRASRPLTYAEVVEVEKLAQKFSLIFSR